MIGEEEQQLVRRVIPGSPCASDADCGHGQACYGEPGECLCAPGLAMCGDECLDLAGDRHHCGACDHVCNRGRACIEGLCEGDGEGAGIQALVMDNPDLISPGDPVHECTQEQYDGFNEAYPERSINGDTNVLYAAFNRYKRPPQGGDGEFYNASDNNIDPNWGTPPPAREVWVANSYYTVGDPWATTSGVSEYLSFILKETAVTDRTCIGIGGADRTQLQAGSVWSRPVQCANLLDNDFDDGPAIHFDLGAPRLWAVALEIPQAPPPGYNICGANTGSDPGVCLYLFSPCQGPQPWPTTAGCPQAFQKKVQGDIQGHPTVIASPVTHDAIVAYRTLDDRIQIKFFNAAGNQVGALFDVRTSMDYGETSDCASGCGQPGHGTVPKCGGCLPDCGRANECAKLVSKVHLAVKHDTVNSKVYLYLAYDELCALPGPDGVRHMMARVDVVEITNETAPALRKGFTSGSCGANSANDFASNVSMTANTYSGGDTRLGHFYYRQPSVSGFPDSCNTIYTGQWGAGFVPPGANLTSLGTIGGPFPTMTFETARGMGDYAAAIRRGTTAYWFYPTWAQPVRVLEPGVNCEACDGAEYSLAVFGRRLKP